MRPITLLDCNSSSTTSACASPIMQSSSPSASVKPLGRTVPYGFTASRRAQSDSVPTPEKKASLLPCLGIKRQAARTNWLIRRTSHPTRCPASAHATSRFPPSAERPAWGKDLSLGVVHAPSGEQRQRQHETTAMVGVPRSSGCQLCRRRKVKCDEARPTCGNCVKYGAECPGYERGLKFVAGKHQIRQRGKRSDGSYRSFSTSSDDSQPLSTTLTYKSSSIVVTSASRRSPALPPPVDRPLQPVRGHVLYTMIEKFCPSAPPDIVRLFDWIQFDHLGKRALLDGAICSLALHLAGKEHSNPQLVAQSRTVYGKSLYELQAALRHPSAWRSSETLFAAILLCFFELFAGTSSPDNWLQHAQGVSVLMEQRGPAAHAEGWDAAMLLSFRGILIMSDMFYPREENCFLSRQEWKPMMRDAGRCLVYAPDTPTKTVLIIDGFFQRLVDVPAVLKWGYLVLEARNAGIPIDPSQLVILTSLAAANHASFSRWYEEEFTSLPQVQPNETFPANPETSLYPTILEYANQWAGAMHLGVWASMLILQETLVQCGTPLPGSDAAKQDLVSKILRSVESVGRGTMGPYRVGYSLRIVYEFASAETQLWIGTLLDKFAKSYAAVDKTTYPAPREDQEGYS